MSHDAQVIVIGAGVSGITTAWALKQAGIRSIVLEGRPRIGGRMHSSYKWKDVPVDLGASWVSHLPINPLVDVARTHKIGLKKSDLFNLNLNEADGHSLDDEHINDLLLGLGVVYSAVKLEAEQRRGRGQPDVALSEVLPGVVDGLKLNKKTQRGVEFFLNLTITEAYAADFRDLSLYEWDDDSTTAPLGWYVVPGGYVKILDVLKKGLDIRLEQVVTTIRHDADGVIVHTRDGDDYRAPYAVITVPHGVLAKNLIRFEPKLPPWKQAAIDRIRTGLSDKFWFLFPRKFWKSSRDVVGRIDPDGKGRWSTWLNFHRYTKHPVLMVFNRTEHAEALEGMTDEAVIKEAMEVLRAEFGPNTPEPIDMQRSTWLSDPFSCGTLPHLPPGATSEDHRTLARPVGRLRFAGDSTHADLPGLVLGAFFSGIREAEKLIEILYLDRLRPFHSPRIKVGAPVTSD